MSEIAQPGLLALLKEWSDRYGDLDDPNFENDLASFRASIEDKDALIERLQKELGEARQLLGEAQVYCPHYPTDGLGNRIAKAIRSMDGGGK